MRASKKAFLYTTLDGIFPFQREAWFSSVLFLWSGEKSAILHHKLWFHHIEYGIFYAFAP